MMTMVEILFGTGVLGGIVTLIYKAGRLVNTIEKLENHLEKDIKPEIVSFRGSISSLNANIGDIQGKVTLLWEAKVSASNSPRVLNETGVKIVNESGVKDILDEVFPAIIEQVRSQNPANAYQAETSTIEAVAALKNNSDLATKLENGAFKTGSDVDLVLFAGALDIRDKVLRELGLNPDDIDKEKTKQV